jgi:predicted O-methyltransferase YrrM
MKSAVKRLMPTFLWNTLRRMRYALRKLPDTSVVRCVNRGLLKVVLKFIRVDSRAVKIFNMYGLNVSLVSDFYSPLPVITSLEKNMHRWFKPSSLCGIKYDLKCMQERLAWLISNYFEEYENLFSYTNISKKGYGPGYPLLDSMLLYFMIRDIKPKNYIEIGSGVSTYICSLAAKKNGKTGSYLDITCIDPYPQENLYEVPKIKILNNEIQNIDIGFFDQLHAGDMLFIDSTHILKIDGDVPYLYLEIIPRLENGVIIHIHDIHFPYNIPYPPQYYIFGKKRPVFWNEAMLLQAFLSYNDSYRIIMSLPLLRYFCEDTLKEHISNYQALDQNHAYTHNGSIWIEKRQ